MIVPTNRIIEGKIQYRLIIYGQLIAVGSYDELTQVLAEL